MTNAYSTSTWSYAVEKICDCPTESTSKKETNSWKARINGATHSTPAINLNTPPTDVYITQIVHRLESLHMSTVNTQQVSLAAGISAKESPTCCSQTKSSEVLKQHTTQLRMLSHRWQRLGLQPPILWDTQEHISEHKTDVDARPALKIHPIQISCIDLPRNEQPEDVKTIRKASYSSFTNEHLKENAAKQSVQVESENSDLSDQEKDDIPIFKWETPVELDLRPDSFDTDIETTENEEEEQVYPEVFPFLLKDQDCIVSTKEDMESQENFSLTESCLAAIVARMIKLEKLQTATIQKEQGKAARSHPATSLIRSGNRPRQDESPCSQVEHLKPKAISSVLDDVAKLTFSSSSYSKSKHRNHLSPNTGKVWVGLQQPPALPKKPHSGVVKLKKTEDVVQVGVSPKCNCPNSSKRCKPTKKAMPKPQRTFYEKTNVHANAPCRKT